jgi:hypothetical protein
MLGKLHHRRSGEVGGEGVGGVAVEGVAGAVVAPRGARVAVYQTAVTDPQNFRYPDIIADTFEDVARRVLAEA